MLDRETIDGLSPGVRDKVIALDAAGFRTTDSGDGTNYANGMEDAQPYRHIWIIVHPDTADTAMAKLRDVVSAWEDADEWVCGAFDPGPNGVDTLYVHGIESGDGPTTEGDDQ